jgi:hypothetical protein
MLCVLLAYIFLIGPEAFHHFTQGAIQYGDLTSAKKSGPGWTRTSDQPIMSRLL